MNSWTNLVGSLTRLPGIGPKMAERLALYLLRHPAEAQNFLETLGRARERLKRCPSCGDFVEAEEEASDCGRCTDPAREAGLLCVVEEVGDLQAIERSRAFRGRYHVLGGVLSALDGVGPEELRIDGLLGRVRDKGVTEVVLATNPTAEGETTAAYLADLLKPLGVSVTRLAYGLPSGSAIQYADEFTLAQALAGRRAIA
ncbi:MAG: recombination mediator RecR [Elusimicrobiota bacterium]